MNANQAALRVDVLVDLLWGPAAGGHVKCWERLAEAAVELPEEIDLTVHFSGTAANRHELAANVRYLIHPPVFSTRRLWFLDHIPDDTDLAPFHPGLARRLGRAQVIHTTDAFFAFARTARVMSWLYRKPLVNSVHTDTPSYTRLFTADLIRRRCGTGWLGRWLLERLQLDRHAERRMQRRLERHQRASDYALVSSEAALQELRARLGPGRSGLMRRGIDRTHFSPARRDRGWLYAAYGIPVDRVVVLCVGRINQGKNVMTLAYAVRRLHDQGLPVHLFCAGDGDERRAVQALLGTAVTSPGVVERETLARLYASANLFAMPSEIEVFANVVLEALASGLPALVAAGSGMGRMLRAGLNGVEIPGRDVTAWEQALRELIEAPERRRQLAVGAITSARTELPSWAEVLRQDLLPVWQRVAQKRPLRRPEGSQCTATGS